MFSFFKRPKAKPLYFHRISLDQEFSGDTPEEVVQALYEDSKIGMGNISFDEWWEYQRWVAGLGGFERDFPEQDNPEPCQKLLVYFLKGGGLSYGELSKE